MAKKMTLVLSLFIKETFDPSSKPSKTPHGVEVEIPNPNSPQESRKQENVRLQLDAIGEREATACCHTDSFQTACAKEIYHSMRAERRREKNCGFYEFQFLSHQRKSVDRQTSTIGAHAY